MRLLPRLVTGWRPATFLEHVPTLLPLTMCCTMEEINTQLTNVYGSPKFSGIPSFKKGELNQNLSTVKEQRKEEPYKENAIIFLEELYSYEDFLKLYDQALYEVILKVQEDMLEIDLFGCISCPC